MAALADTWQQHRQQCIDVLCGYLRLPYDPSEGLLAEIVKERTWPVGEADEHGRGEMQKETRTYRSLPNDREVRHTIIRVITEHLRDTAPIPWHGRDLDFTGAVFDGGDFYEARFSGGEVSFDRAEFSGGLVSFIGAEFSGGLVSFAGAKFSGGLVSFAMTKFSGGEVSFVEAKFSGALVSFAGAEFSGGWVNLSGTEVFDGQVVFYEARFSGGKVTLIWAKFFGGEVIFDESKFDGGRSAHGGARVLMSSYDRAMPGWPTKDGELFFGWPPPEAASGAESSDGREAGE